MLGTFTNYLTRYLCNFGAVAELEYSKSLLPNTTTVPSLEPVQMKSHYCIIFLRHLNYLKM